VTTAFGERDETMSTPLSFPTTRTVTVPVAFFHGLSRSTKQGQPAIPVDAVRDAGYAAGQALFDHFTTWLANRHEPGPGDLLDTRFPILLRAYFSEIGWGLVQLSSLGEAVLMLEATTWGEAGDDANGRPVSTGLFAGFFGRLANAPISVLDVTADTAAEGECRFLLGSVDVLNHVREAMGRGIPYARAAASA
jgi:hypothetical protein